MVSTPIVSSTNSYPGSRFPDPMAGIHISVDELIRLRLKARGLNLETRRRAQATNSGVHHSRFRGRGIDYLESRNYQPGDDIRNMDWRVTARTGRAHTKLYQEERERPVIVMVDLSPSMFFGTRVAFKSVIAAQAAALIGWSTVTNGDRIGAFFFGRAGRVSHHEIPPAGGRRGVLRMIRELVHWTTPDEHVGNLSQDGLGEALRRIRRVARPGSLVLILSDFYSVDDETERHLTHLRQHNDVIACQIWDRLELSPPPPGRYGISDGEHLGVLDTSSNDFRQRYEGYFVDHHLRIRNLLVRRGVPLLRLVTDEDVADKLRRGLNMVAQQGPGAAA